MRYYWLTVNRKMRLVEYRRRWSLDDMPVGETDSDLMGRVGGCLSDGLRSD